MMTSISGERGVGKTAYLSKRVTEFYNKGFLIITNFSHALAHIDCSQGDPDTMLKVIREIGIFKKRNYEPCDLIPTFHHSGIYVAIDEGSLAFPARSGSPLDEYTMFTLQFLQQARKQDVFIDYTTVHPSKIAIDWRRFTSEYVRLVPVINWRRWVMVEHPRLKSNPNVTPTWRRDMRLVIPLIRAEWYNLAPEEPEYRRSAHYKSNYYWQSKFYFNLYDSYQLLQMNIEAMKDEDFPTLKDNICYIPPGYKKDHFPTFKKIVGKKPSDFELPTRYRLEGVELPTLNDPFGNNILNQKEEIISDREWFLEKKKQAVSLFRRKRKKTPVDLEAEEKRRTLERIKKERNTILQRNALSSSLNNQKSAIVPNGLL